MHPRLDIFWEFSILTGPIFPGKCGEKPVTSKQIRRKLHEKLLFVWWVSKP